MVGGSAAAGVEKFVPFVKSIEEAIEVVARGACDFRKAVHIRIPLLDGSEGEGFIWAERREDFGFPSRIGGNFRMGFESIGGVVRRANDFDIH